MSKSKTRTEDRRRARHATKYDGFSQAPMLGKLARRIHHADRNDSRSDGMERRREEWDFMPDDRHVED